MSGNASSLSGRRPPLGATLAALRSQRWTTPSSRRGERGWTLIELVVVMAIIAILAAIAMTQYGNAVTLTKEAVLKENLFRMRDAIDQYYADKGRYPSDLQALVGDKYMREVPLDPFTDSRETWQTIPAEADPANPSAEPGIYNVKSGTDRQSLHGQPYNDW